MSDTATTTISLSKEVDQQKEDLIVVQNLKKYFSVKREGAFLKKDYIKAVDDVSFTIKKGETFGLVGESGSGKSTLGRMIVNLIPPTEGNILFENKNILQLNSKDKRSIRKDLQVVFQDPMSSLNPRMKIIDIIAEPFSVHHVHKGKEREERVIELMKLVGLDPEKRNAYPHEMSGGQRQRVGIARAIALNPKFILADEAVSALDVSVQAQVINLLKQLQKELNLTYLFIAHGLNVVKHISDRVGVMYLGELVEIGETEKIFESPLHPYTQALMDTNPIADPRKRREKIILAGEIPSPSNPPTGCRFHPRCAFATEQCKTVPPKLSEYSDGSLVACHYPLENRSSSIITKK